ncbi:MAG: chorismate synthase [Parasporobacterium sp.]|nr:chorismate synthase [Parasporobacterium sp.]
MSSTYGEMIRLTIFGQSHSPAIGMTLEGIPAGSSIDMEKLERFLARRAPGRNAWSTPRAEADRPEFVAGLLGNVTCGVPLTAIIRNTDTRSGDYEELKKKPRPGHADLTAQYKYHGFQDHAGGGHFSGRMTAPLCIAGGICRQLLEKEGVKIMARIAVIGDVEDESAFLTSVEENEFPVVSPEKGILMQQRIEQAREEGDSIGGIIECVVTGLPVGLGDPMFHGMENRIAQAVFAIPAVKGLEFGAGFAAARMRGSEHNDPFRIRDGKIVTETNHAGGILGGITDGMPICFRAAVKPTPSIAKSQQSVDLEAMKETSLEIRGRHDPCIVPRAVPCMEAAAALAVYDAFLAYKAQQ